MKRLLLVLIGVAMWLAAAPLASASPITFNDLDAGDIGKFAGHKFKVHTPHFVDNYVFTVADNNTNVVLDFTLKGTIALALNLTYSDTTGLHSFSLGALSSTGAATGTFTLAGLMAGTQYFLDVIGAACSCSKYEMDIADVSVAAAPLPAALVMFLTSIGGLGGVAWRRRKAAPAGLAA